MRGHGLHADAERRDQLARVGADELPHPARPRANANSFGGGKVRRRGFNLRRRRFQQQRLITPICDQKRESLDRGFGRVEVGEASRFERIARLRSIDCAEPRGEERFARALGGGSNRARRIGRRRSGCGDVQHDAGVDIGIREHQRKCVRKAFGRRFAAQIDRVVEPGARRKEPRERVLGLSRQACQRDACFDGTVGGEESRASSVGKDRHPVAPWHPIGRQHAGGGEELRVRAHADGAGASQRRVEHAIGRRRG